MQPITQRKTLKSKKLDVRSFWKIFYNLEYRINLDFVIVRAIHNSDDCLNLKPKFRSAMNDAIIVSQPCQIDSIQSFFLHSVRVSFGAISKYVREKGPTPSAFLANFKICQSSDRSFDTNVSSLLSSSPCSIQWLSRLRENVDSWPSALTGLRL